MTDEFEINRARYAKMLEARKPFKKIFGKIELETVPILKTPFAMTWRIWSRWKTRCIPFSIAEMLRSIRSGLRNISVWPQP